MAAWATLDVCHIHVYDIDNVFSLSHHLAIESSNSISFNVKSAAVGFVTDNCQSRYERFAAAKQTEFIFRKMKTKIADEKQFLQARCLTGHQLLCNYTTRRDSLPTANSKCERLRVGYPGCRRSKKVCSFFFAHSTFADF